MVSLSILSTVKRHAVLWIVRVGGTLACIALLFLSWRTAHANILADSPQSADLDRALALEPDNPTYQMRKAQRSIYGDKPDPAEARHDLEAVLRSNPRNADALMELGLLAESEGDKAGAEEYLRKSAALDRTFKPIWTLANFYYRNGDTARMTTAIRDALAVTAKPGLDFFDPRAIYDLCWRSGLPPQQILDMVPRNTGALRNYFFYLAANNHLAAARDVYPLVLPSADPANDRDREIFTGYCDSLYRAGQVMDAVNVWNQLVEKHLLNSTAIRMAEANTIANPSFNLPLGPRPFGWVISPTDNILISVIPGALRLEFDGRQPETISVMTKELPLEPGHDYRLTWDVERSGVMRPADPTEAGLQLRFYNGAQPLPQQCSPLLAPEKERGCNLRVPEGIHAFHMALTYERPAGSIRMRGTVQVRSFKLKLNGG